MHRLLSLAAALLALASLAISKTPRPLADVTFLTPPGMKAVKLTSYPGKVMVVTLFSTECSTCIQAMQIFEKLNKQYASRGVVFAGAAANPGAISLLRGFKDRYRITIPMGVVNEADARKVADLGAKDRLKVPSLMFVDKKGRVQFEYAADSPFLGELEKNTRAVIEGLLRQ